MIKVELSTRGIALVALGLVALWVVVQIWAVVLLVITALIFMAALEPYVAWMAGDTRSSPPSRPVPRRRQDG